MNPAGKTFLVVGYYNASRPHSSFGGRTPDEVYATDTWPGEGRTFECLMETHLTSRTPLRGVLPA